VCQAVDLRAPELKQSEGLTDLARPTRGPPPCLIRAFALDPPRRGFPRAHTGYARPLRGATGAPRPRSTWAPIAYCLYFDTPLDRLSFPYIYIYRFRCPLSFVVGDCCCYCSCRCRRCLRFRAPFVLSNTRALAYVELLLCSSACASIPFALWLSGYMRQSHHFQYRSIYGMRILRRYECIGFYPLNCQFLFAAEATSHQGRSPQFAG
jgi:hypothetical protein